MHSIAISPGVEDSAHLRTLPLPPAASTSLPSLLLVPPSCRRRGWGLEGSCIQLITPPGLITSRPGSRPTYKPLLLLLLHSASNPLALYRPLDPPHPPHGRFSDAANSHRAPTHGSSVAAGEISVTNSRKSSV
ncbi:hypothetical protein KM043_009191 [Ampulex compressa]|nr:hypothetical protein KM043_009191 [Ampulex compressa]